MINKRQELGQKLKIAVGCQQHHLLDT
uniref:Uncharacterized protein n=1 Tax=Rhizophora mucronata TaxID=61149 RepID=A0A2P2P2B1_RHIMU